MVRSFEEEAASLDFSDEFSVQFHGLSINSVVNKKYIYLPPNIYMKLKLTSEQNKVFCYRITEIDFGTAQRLRLIMTI